MPYFHIEIKHFVNKNKDISEMIMQAFNLTKLNITKQKKTTQTKALDRFLKNHLYVFLKKKFPALDNMNQLILE